LPSFVPDGSLVSFSGSFVVPFDVGSPGSLRDGLLGSLVCCSFASPPVRSFVGGLLQYTVLEEIVKFSRVNGRDELSLPGSDLD
jgi:hypothetical protein